MQKLLLALVVFGAFAFTQAAPKGKYLPIVLDDWWNVDYVKNGCQLSVQDGGHPCVTDSTPAELVREFEDKLILAFASEDACHGLTLLHFTPEMAQAAVKNPNAPASPEAAKTLGPNWSLMLDLSGRSHVQTGRGWTLVDSERHVLNGRITTPQRTAQQICKVVKSRGGQLGN